MTCGHFLKIFIEPLRHLDRYEELQEDVELLSHSVISEPFLAQNKTA